MIGLIISPVASEWNPFLIFLIHPSSSHRGAGLDFAVLSSSLSCKDPGNNYAEAEDSQRCVQAVQEDGHGLVGHWHRARAPAQVPGSGPGDALPAAIDRRGPVHSQ